ncbi:kinesin-13A-like [Pyrus ussuriensis x Pyrus communis]|uniref:Kinesin-13A-like n=1 Tax=Pyrus ussuriensis x Pyrus communis TaxID=2448454 RepID=A0A5N5GSK3_9ROSA|nr:kinesin-13A-like [Pyrus ussuriensis x Pyrus communis]
MHHHHRQYSDHFTDSPSKWLQSPCLSHSQSSTVPPIASRSSSMRRNGDDRVSPSELSPGLLPEVLLRAKLWYVSFGRFKKLGFRKMILQVRKRPLNKKEFAKKEEDIIAIEPHSNALTVHETKLQRHNFFYAVLNEDVSNDEVYFEKVEPIVPLIFNRTKATCFAYGQTGSGKTYTMQPLPLKASQDILRLTLDTYRNQGFQLFVSFFKIYGGKLFDLLMTESKKLCMREDGKQQVCIVGLQEYRVSNVEMVREFIEKGNSTRSTGTTGADEESSRSHAVLQLCKLSFIDLAGSEHSADTTDSYKHTSGDFVVMEGAEINKSFLALKEGIRAPDSNQGHIPFRGSKLTEVLRDSFVGDSCAVMISCISPSSGSCEQTLNTLRYADRVKSLSKGSGFKRYQFSSLSNLRDSTTMPLSFEEEDLGTAHRRQEQHMIDIVWEEMNLLVQADQPGNPIDDYICKLNAILSQKASGILQLQTQLAHFLWHLNDHSVLVSSSSSN